MKMTWRPESKSGGWTEHRVHRRHLAAGIDQALEAASQWRLERAEVEDDSGGSSPGKLEENGVGDAERCRHDDEIVVERARLPVRPVPMSGDATGGIGNLDPKSLRRNEIDEPAAHLARAPDDERRLPGSMTLRADLGLLLGGEWTSG